MRAITGCLHTTTIKALEHETELLSPKWRLTRQILQTATRMMTTARNHPIQAWINRAITFGRSPYILNLEKMVKKYPKYIRRDTEHIAPQVRPPWWTLKATTKISSLNKEEEAKAHKLRLRQIRTHDLVIYTDGLGYVET